MSRDHSKRISAPISQPWTQYSDVHESRAVNGSVGPNVTTAAKSDARLVADTSTFRSQEVIAFPLVLKGDPRIVSQYAPGVRDGLIEPRIAPPECYETRLA